MPLPTGFAIKRRNDTATDDPTDKPTQPAPDSPFVVDRHRRGGALLWLWVKRLGLGLLVLSGFFQLVVNPIRRATDTPPPVEAVVTLDTAAATQLAVAFTGDYLSYDSSSPDVRSTALERWTGSTPTPAWTGTGQLRADLVTAGSTLLHGEDQVVVQTTARVTPAELTGETPEPVNPEDLPAGFAATPRTDPGFTPGQARWVTLDVAVTSTSSGLQVTSAAFTGDAPAAVEATAEADPALTGTTRELPATVFTALATGDLDYLTAPGVTLNGLSGALEFVDVTAWSIDNSPTPTDRRATVSVTWQLAGTSLVIPQRYALHLTEDAGRWLVVAVSTDLEV